MHNAADEQHAHCHTAEVSRVSAELARLNASFLAAPDVRHADRVRFLRTYLNAGPRRPETWKAWWAAVAGATVAKVAKNRRTGRPLA